jgi:hypothetical protein
MRGLGRIERGVLETLREWQTRNMPRCLNAIELASRVYNVKTNDDGELLVTDAQRSGVRRALVTLKRKGLVDCGDRHWHQGRRPWWPTGFVRRAP